VVNDSSDFPFCEYGVLTGMISSCKPNDCITTAQEYIHRVFSDTSTPRPSGIALSKLLLQSLPPNNDTTTTTTQDPPTNELKNTDTTTAVNDNTTTTNTVVGSPDETHTTEKSTAQSQTPKLESPSKL